MSKRLLKSGMIVSAMTLISRVLGLVRDVVVANLMGQEQALTSFSSPTKFRISYDVCLLRGLFLKRLSLF